MSEFKRKLSELVSGQLTGDAEAVATTIALLTKSLGLSIAIRSKGDIAEVGQITAMKAGEKERLAAVRLILSKIKDRDIELRTATNLPDDDAMVTEVLQKMVKQRRESITLYEQGNRPELAAIETAELLVIEEFLPLQMSEAETSVAIEAIKAELGANSLKDMGRVMATLKERHGPQLDMSKASGLVKAALA